MNSFLPSAKSWLKAGLACLLLAVGSIDVQAALKGTYTINPSATASSTNYRNIASALSDLESGTRSDGGTAQGAGVSGHVVFNISNGNYNELLTVGIITGTSDTSTITFQSLSGDSTKVFIYQATSSSTTGNFVLDLNGADWMTWKQVTFARTGTDVYAKVVTLQNGASNNRFLNCRFIGKMEPSNTTNSFNTDYNALVTSSGTDTNNLYQYNHFRYGYNGFYMTTTHYSNFIYDNIFDTIGSSAIYATTQNNFKIKRNYMTLGSYGPNSGHYVSYGVRLESSPTFEITENVFYLTNDAQVVRGLVFFNNTASSTNPNLVANNFILITGGSTSSTGMATAGNSYFDFVHNNILMTASVKGSSCIYIYPPTQAAGTDNNFINNNLVHKGGGYCFDISGNTAGVGTSNYNNLFTNGSYTGNWNATDYATLANWQSGSGEDANTIASDPGYVSNLNLRASSVSINNKGTAFARVTKDIDGVTRNATTPDIGANEFSPATVDAGVSRLDAPNFFCAGSQAVKVTFANFGVNAITSGTINWSVNGTLQTPISISSTVASAAQSASLTLGNFTFSANVAYRIKSWITSPNGTTDGNHTNDTLDQVIYTGMSGDYTVGGATPAFGTLNQAIIALTSRGVCGPVTLKVRNGTYSEQISVPRFSGASATNTVTLTSESGDSTKVIISLPAANANGVNNVLVQFNGARHFIIDRITMTRTGSSIYQGIMELKGGSTYNTVKRCRIIGTRLTSAIVEANLVVSATIEADTANIFQDNLMRYGYYGFYFNGPSGEEVGNKFIHNVIDSTYNTPINLIFNNSPLVSGNTFLNPSYGIVGPVVEFNNCNGTLRVHNNNMHIAGGTSAIRILNCTGPSSSTTHIINNVISINGTSTGSTTNGFSIENSTNQGLYFNSISLNSPSNTGAPVNISGTSSGASLINNILANAGGGRAIVISASSVLGTCNYNNFFSGSSTIATVGSNNQTALSDWQTTTGKDANSLQVNPYFKSNTELNPFTPYMNNKATPIAGITIDNAGVARNTLTPDIGAFEFNSPRNEVEVLAIISPKTSFCEDSTHLEFTIRNNGLDTLKSVKVDFRANGSLIGSQTLTGLTMAPGATRTVTMPGKRWTPAVYAFTAKASLPNNVLDSFPINDSIRIISNVVANATANVGQKTRSICNGASVTIGASAVSGNSYSWTSKPAGFTSNQSSATITPTVSTTYYLLQTNAGGCSATDSVVVTVNANPLAIVGSNQTICNGASVTLGSTTPIAGHTYAWSSTPAGFSASTSSITVAPSATTTYRLVETITASGCSRTASAIITVLAAPTANVAADQSICVGSSVSLGATPVPGTSYAWTSIPAGFGSGQANPSVKPTTTTTYILRATLVATGCFDIDTVVITVNPKANAQIAGQNVVCTGVPVTYTAQNPDLLNNYNWTVTGGSIVSGAGTNQVGVSWSGSGGTIRLIQTPPSGCSDTDLVNIAINTGTVAKFGGRDVCLGAAISFRDSSTNASSFLYRFGDGTTSTLQNPTKTYAQAGVYNVTLLVTSAQGCRDSAVRKITVYNQANANFAHSTECQGTQTSFANTSSNSSSYLWRFGDGTTSTDQFPKHLYANAGTYQVTLVAYSNGGCSDSVTRSVAVRTLPGAAFTFTQNKATVQFTATTAGLQEYAWEFGDGKFALGQTVSHTYTSDGSYNVALRTRNLEGCINSTSQTIVINGLSLDNAINEWSRGITIYPNPSTGILNIRFESPATQLSIEVLTMDGKSILRKSQVAVAANGSLDLSQNTAQWSPGVYMVKIQNNQGAVSVLKWIKQ